MPMRCLHIAALPFLLACAWSGAYAADGGPVGAATGERIRSFLDRFVDANKSPAEAAALFADDVQYNERRVLGKDEILRETARYHEHWPYRRFRVSEIAYMNADPQSNRVCVAYTVDFEVANSLRAISGKAHYAALIEDADGMPKMKAIRERGARRLPGSPGLGLAAPD